MRREFTGRHMAAILVAGFGVVVAVNLLMAMLAVGGFSGVVVENSYVASQRFNTWLGRARRQDALGWQADVSRLGDGRIAVTTRSVPTGAKVAATLRRPLGQREITQMPLMEEATGRYVSARPLPAGRWIARVGIAASGHDWVIEVPLS